MPDPATPPPMGLDNLPLFRPLPGALQVPQRPARGSTPPAPRTAPPAQPRPAVAPAMPQGTQVDWRLVRAMRSEAAEQLATSLAERPDLDEAAQQERAKAMILDLLRSHDTAAGIGGQRTFAQGELQHLQQAIFDSLYGLGRLQPLVDDRDVENISILGCDNVWLLKSDGRIVRGPAVADSDEELIADIQFLASRSGTSDREFSRAKPILDKRLAGGQRLAATAWVSPRPLVSIRIHRIRDVGLDDLVAGGTLDANVASLLKAAVRAGKSIVVTGDRGSGKTVLLRALAAEFHPSEAITVIETESELMLEELPHRHQQVWPLEARQGGTEKAADGSRVGEITVSDLLYRAQRLPPNRIIVGEVRGSEVIAMLQAMQAGAGSMSTTHAYSASAAVDRLVTMAMDSGRVSEEFAQRQVASHIDLIVHISFAATQALQQAVTATHAGVSIDDAGLTRRHRRYVADVIALELGDRGATSRGHSETRVYVPGPDGTVLSGTLPEGLRQDLVAAGFDEDTYNRRRR